MWLDTKIANFKVTVDIVINQVVHILQPLVRLVLLEITFFLFLLSLDLGIA